MSYQLPELDYPYDALEPYIDEETLRIHHTRHHQKYVDKYNEAVQESPVEGETLEEILPKISKVQDAVAKNGGQAFNHTFYWKSLAPGGRDQPGGELSDAIKQDFESFEQFKNRFNTVAAATFGSGWAWLIKKDGKLEIVSTSNHINPLMDVAEEQGKPLLCIDVWEHAYYLKYRNKRPDYLDACWNIINWEEVERRYGS